MFRKTNILSIFKASGISKPISNYDIRLMWRPFSLRISHLFIVFCLVLVNGCGSGGSGVTPGGAGSPNSVSGPVLGLSSVQDGTPVSLNRIDDSGKTVQNVAVTTTSGGRYSFDLMVLGVNIGSSLIVQFTDPASGKPVRAFVVSQVVNLDFASETAVRMVLEMTSGGTGKTLQNFTASELSALSGALDLLALIHQDYSLSNIEAIIAKIRQDFQASPELVNFLDKASESGESGVGTGDVGNYFPNRPGNVWRFKGITTSSGSSSTSYVTSDAITGTKNVNGIDSDVYLNGTTSQSNYIEKYRKKTSQGMTYQGDNDTQTSFLAPFIPYQDVKFPLREGDTFIQAEKSGILLWDFDRDGVADRTDLKSEITVDGFENINVPAGLFNYSARITTKLTVSIHLSKDQSTITYLATETDWFAPGIGRVKSTVSSQVTHGQSVSSDSGEEDLIGVIIDGQGQGVRRLVTPSHSRVTVGVQVTITPADVDPNFSMTWVSGNTNIAVISPSYNSNGNVTALSPGTGVVFALQNGQISDPAILIIEDAKTVKLGINDIVYSPLTKMLYASTASDSNTFPGTITAIDPLTGQIGPSLSVGDMPGYIFPSGKLALSRDGRYLYVGLYHGVNTGGGIRMVDLVAWTVGQEFNLGPGSFCGPLFPGEIRVLPDNPNAIAVSLANRGCSPNFEGVAIYDNGIPRINKISGPISLQFSDNSSILYGFDSTTLYQISVDTNGVQITNTIPGIITLPTSSFKFDLGKLYFQHDPVVDVTNWNVIGAYPGIPWRAQVQPDSSVNRTFFLVGNSADCYEYVTCRILIFDQNNFNLIDTITVDVSHYDVPGPAVGTNLIRWGSDGLAIVTSGSQLILVRSPLIAGQ